MLQRPSLPHTPGPQTPTSPPHNPHPCALPLKPCKSPLPPLPHGMQAWPPPSLPNPSPPPPPSCDANMACRTPPPCHNDNMSHRTLPPCHPQHSMQNGAVVGMVVVVDSGMVVMGMAATARHSYYLRLYIFYLCNKLILFLYFVIKANNK